MRSRHAAQRGATLVIALVLLVVVTLMGVSAMNVSNLNLRNVANMQHRQLVLTCVMEAAENYISSYNNFNPVTSAASTYSCRSLTINLTKPRCIYSYRTYGKNTTSGQLCAALDESCGVWENYFDFGTSVTDNLTGAATNVRYGIMIQGGKCQ